MSRFKNLLDTQLWLTDEHGRNFYVKAREEFTGTNFFKKYTSQGAQAQEHVILAIVEDDGIPYVKNQRDVPNFLKSWEFQVTGTESWDDHKIDFTSRTNLGSEALFLQILVDDAPVEVKINNSESSIFRMDSGSTQIFNTGELLVAEIAFRVPTSSGTLPANVRLLAATSTAL